MPAKVEHLSGGVLVTVFNLQDASGQLYVLRVLVPQTIREMSVDAEGVSVELAKDEVLSR